MSKLVIADNVNPQENQGEPKKDVTSEAQNLRMPSNEALQAENTQKNVEIAGAQNQPAEAPKEEPKSNKVIDHTVDWGKQNLVKADYDNCNGTKACCCPKCTCLFHLQVLLLIGFLVSIYTIYYVFGDKESCYSNYTDRRLKDDKIIQIVASAICFVFLYIFCVKSQGKVKRVIKSFLKLIFTLAILVLTVIRSLHSLSFYNDVIKDDRYGEKFNVTLTNNIGEEYTQVEEPEGCDNLKTLTYVVLIASAVVILIFLLMFILFIAQTIRVFREGDEALNQWGAESYHDAAEDAFFAANEDALDEVIRRDQEREYQKRKAIEEYQRQHPFGY